MAYADLSAEQEAQLDDWATNMRAWMGELQRVINRGEALKDAYNGQDGVSSLFDVGGAWADTEPIPNKSGLAGAAPLETLDFKQMVTQHLNKLLVDASAYTSGFNVAGQRQDRVAAAGPTNT